MKAALESICSVFSIKLRELGKETACERTKWQTRMKMELAEWWRESEEIGWDGGGAGLSFEPGRLAPAGDSICRQVPGHARPFNPCFKDL